MPVALADHVGTVDGSDDAVAVKPGLVGAEPHGAAQVAMGFAPLKPFLAHPLGDEADHRLVAFAEFARAGTLDSRRVPRRFDTSHLHAEADTEEGDFAFAREMN